MQKKSKEPSSIIKWAPLLAAIIVPGSGHVILNKPLRGLFYILWIFMFGFITFKITGENISLIGRWSGGIAVWVFSVIEVGRMLKGKK